MLKEWRLHFTLVHLASPTILALALWNLSAGRNSPLFAPRMSELIQVFGVFWPLALCIGVATILPYERQSGMFALRLTYARPYWLSLLQKLALPISLWALWGSLGLIFSYYNYLAFPTWQLLGIIVPPTVALAGFTLFSSVLTLNMPASLLATVAWWGFELATGCRLSGQLALFPIPMGRVDVNLVLNHWLLLTIGLLLAIAGILLLPRRQLPTVEE
ncbi:MAG: hypothetical protein ACOX2K_09075 [Bacillota bacterium]|jgi:hypothetical protein